MYTKHLVRGTLISRQSRQRRIAGRSYRARNEMLTFRNLNSECEYVCHIYFTLQSTSSHLKNIFVSHLFHITVHIITSSYLHRTVAVNTELTVNHFLSLSPLLFLSTCHQEKCKYRKKSNLIETHARTNTHIHAHTHKFERIYISI